MLWCATRCTGRERKRRLGPSRAPGKRISGDEAVSPTVCPPVLLPHAHHVLGVCRVDRDVRLHLCIGVVGARGPNGAPTYGLGPETVTIAVAEEAAVRSSTALADPCSGSTEWHPDRAFRSYSGKPKTIDMPESWPRSH
jgi:hypothetical protein